MSCRAMMSSGRFDPGLCPLLEHLPPDEQVERMRSDPLIAACIRAVNRRANAAVPVHNAERRRSSTKKAGADA